MTIFTRAILAASAIALLAVPAYSQNEGGNRPTRRTDAQKQEDADIDKAYRAATKGDVIPSVKHDPWGTVRASDTDKTDKTKR
jgi:hypothetical protein